MSVREITLEGLTGPLRGLETGSRAGRPLVCLHGWLDNAASFLPLSECLPQYRWICLDLPGHGHSAARPDGCSYHFTDYAGDLYHALETLELDRCTLVGHSLGAGIAAVFAAAFPGRVDRMVLIDGLGPVSGSDDRSVSRLRGAMADLVRRESSRPRYYSSWDEVVKKRLAAGSIHRESVEILLSRGAMKKGDGVLVLSDSRLKHASPVHMSEGRVRALLAGIVAPVLLIVASRGVLVGRENTAGRISMIADLSRVDVTGGHHVHLDDPDQIATVIDRHLRTASPR